MRIHHLALWVQDLEGMKEIYLKYFKTTVGKKYTNPTTQLASYFIFFGEGKTRLELMKRPDIELAQGRKGFTLGLAHFAISIGGKDKVNALTERLRNDNYTIFSEPRTTGDGYYESVILDPEGNPIEIAA